MPFASLGPAPHDVNILISELIGVAREVDVAGLVRIAHAISAGHRSA